MLEIDKLRGDLYRHPLDIEKLRGEIRQQAKADTREMIRLVLGALAAGAALMGAAVALARVWA